MTLSLLIGYHKSSSKERNSEYHRCIQTNLENPHIDTVHIFLDNNRDRPPIEHEKIIYETNKGSKSFSKHKEATRGEARGYLVRKDRGRATYGDFFKFCSENLEGKNCIVSNTDIMFDTSLGNISDVDLGNTFLCLTRWDIKEDGKEVFFNRSDSQDVWIFTSPISGQLAEDSDFFLGRKGCDNKIAYLAHKYGMKVTNPAHLIKARHLHLVDHRTYLKEDRVGGAYNDEFLKVHPTDDWELSRIGKVAEQYDEYK